MKLERYQKKISKKAKKGFQGYTIATIAFYGPNHKLATKFAVGVITKEGGEASMERFFSESDVRRDVEIQSKVVDIVERSGAKSVSMIDGIIGCPHEEGVDYATGQEFPECKYWQGRDRFTGEYIQ